MKSKILWVGSLFSLAILSPSFASAADGGLAAQGAFQSKGFAGGVFVDAVCDLFSLVGGEFGAMLTSAAIVTGLVAAAVGGFRSLRSAVVVAVSCFAITSSVSVYFGNFQCAGVTNTQAPRQAANVENNPFEEP